MEGATSQRSTETDDLVRPLSQTLAFSVNEYRRRVRRVEDIIATRALDAILITTLGNICYLTGFQTIASYSFALYATLIEPGQDPTLVSSDFESHNALLDSWVEDVRTYPVMGDPVESMVALIRERGLQRSRVGIETGYGAMTAAQLDRLKERLPDVRWGDGSGIVEACRAVKSPAELDVMRKAAAISSAGMRAAISASVEGATDNDVAAAAVQTVVASGGEHFSIVPIVTSGRRTGIPHTSFRRNPLAPHDPVFIEVCGTFERYSAPMLRTVSIGAPSSEVQCAFDACLASVETVIREVRAGLPARTVALSADEAMRQIEPSLVWHGYFGGSTGLSFAPTYSDGGAAEISLRSTTILEAGMTFHASTSLRKIGEFGVTVGETIAVTESGCEVLTDVPRRLVVS